MFHLLARNAKLIIAWGILFALVSGGISLLLPKQYSASSQVLIISRDRSGVDPYTQARSAERIGENLAQVMKTTDFYTKVIESSGEHGFNKERWQTLTDRQRRKQWMRDVQASMAYGTALMNIRVYSSSKEDVEAFSRAVTQVVAGRGWEYLGGDVAIKVVNSPLVSKWPTRPDIPMNTFIGFAVGVLISSLWVLRYKRHLFGR